MLKYHQKTIKRNKTVDIDKIEKQTAQVLEQPIENAKEYWEILGPGLTTGAADDDPSGIATYSQTGAKYGFNLLWLAIFTFPLMAIVQEMCARIGLVTGRGLAANIRQHFPRWILYGCTILLFIANTFNIGADLGALAKAAQLLMPRANFAALVVGFTLFILLMEIFISYGRYAKYLKWLSFILLAYVFTAFIVHIPWSKAFFNGIIPHLHWNKDEILLVCGILGTTISPYLFFWQTSQEVEEKILQGQKTIKQRQAIIPKHIRDMRIDVWSGMFLSNAVMFFIILVCGAVLNANGLTNIQTAEDAARALQPLAGNYAFLLFAIGIIGIGLQAVPTLAGSASYAMAESFKWKEGLYRKFNQARAFYGVMALAMALGLLMNFLHLDPIKTLIYAAVLNGIIAPIVLIPVVAISSSKKIMGSHANTRAVKTLGWVTVGVMGAVGVAVIVGLF